MMRGAGSAVRMTAVCLAIWGLAAFGMWRVIFK